MQGGDADTVVLWMLTLGFIEPDADGFLQCRVVMVKGEATTPSNTCGVNRGSHGSLFCMETAIKFILTTTTHKAYKPPEAAKIDPSFFLRGVGETSSSGPNYSVC